VPLILSLSGAGSPAWARLFSNRDWSVRFELLEAAIWSSVGR